MFYTTYLNTSCCLLNVANYPQLVERARMTITPKISIDNGDLIVHGKTVLKGVPDNIMLTPGSGAGLVSGAFIGATDTNSKSHHVFPVGVLE